MTVKGNRGRIVVGIDGSAVSREALKWALEEARLRNSPLHVVHAWEFPAVAVTHFGTVALPVVASEDIQRAAEEDAKEAVARVAQDDETVPVETTVQRGHPAEVLLAASEGADLLVVGSLGHGGFSGMLLGSVSNHLVHHANCPVVIVKPAADR